MSMAADYYEVKLRLTEDDKVKLDNLADALRVPPALALNWAIHVASFVQDVQATPGRELVVKETDGRLNRVSISPPIPGITTK